MAHFAYLYVSSVMYMNTYCKGQPTMNKPFLGEVLQLIFQSNESTNNITCS